MSEVKSDIPKIIARLQVQLLKRAGKLRIKQTRWNVIQYNRTKQMLDSWTKKLEQSKTIIP